MLYLYKKKIHKKHSNNFVNNNLYNFDFFINFTDKSLNLRFFEHISRLFDIKSKLIIMK